MSDPELNLSDLAKRTAPQPRIEAALLARRAAMEAFELDLKNNFSVTKGSAKASRLSRTATQIWSLTMNLKYVSGTALATLFIVPIAGITTFELMRSERGTTLKDATVIEQSLAGKSDTSVAPKAGPIIENYDVVAAKPVMLNPEKKKAELKANQAAVKMAAPAPLASGRSAVQISPNSVAPQIVLDSEFSLQPTMEARDKFPEAKSNSIVVTAVQPVSTFSIDVDTSGYSSLRRALNQGLLPEPETVRVEEMINYFPYGYAGPDNAAEAFKANVTVTPSPWNEHTKLLHVGIKGFDLPVETQKPANLVFLIDVSGSMDEADKLPLLKASFRLLVNNLKPTDTVSIVTYAGNAGIVLEPTKASDQAKILQAIDNLQPGGSTAGEAGIHAAYQLAQQAFVKDGVNRIMLATDGDFNVGASSEDDLKKLVEEKRKTGVFLSILGFGQGNYRDNLSQTLAQNGNGIAAYIDTLSEAEKVLVQEATASLFTIAKDVKIQVEFNPARVSEYRLIGYETRALANQDFNNDRVDAGDIGSGHTVTAIYEMTMKGAPGQTTDPLRYKTQQSEKVADESGEYAFVKLRYKLPNESKSRLVDQPVTDANAVADLANAAEDVRFSIAVSAMGQKLRDEDSLANYSFEQIEQLAAASKGTDVHGYRGEFIKLVRLAGALVRL